MGTDLVIPRRVGLFGAVGESHHAQVCPLHIERAEGFRETHVKTDAEAHAQTHDPHDARKGAKGEILRIPPPQRLLTVDSCRFSAAVNIQNGIISPVPVKADRSQSRVDPIGFGRAAEPRRRGRQGSRVDLRPTAFDGRIPAKGAFVKTDQIDALPGCLPHTGQNMSGVFFDVRRTGKRVETQPHDTTFFDNL